MKMKKYILSLFFVGMFSFVVNSQSSDPETQVVRTDSGDVVLQMEPDVADVVKDTIVNGEEALKDADGTYWRKGRPNFVFLIVPLLIVAAPIVIMRYRRKEKNN